LKVILTGPLPPQPLQLEVADENGFLLYTKPLVPKPQLPDSVPVTEHPEVPVNKRFIFNNQLTIRVLGPPGIAFSAEVHIV
ncbi:MAG TPA: hypothetical protein VK927_05690, partial [Adhaeribacter sp.]|nr:hypothetical protein [Adhaeribacter sp.]